MAKAIQVSFKRKEQDLLDFIKDKDFSYYVKELIRADMNNNKSNNTTDNKTEQPTDSKKRRNLNFEMM